MMSSIQPLSNPYRVIIRVIIKDSMKERKIALAIGNFIEEADQEVLEAVRKAAHVLAEQGALITEVNADFLKEGALANALMTQADGAAFHRDRLKEHPDWFGSDVRQRLETGAAFTSSEYVLARHTQTEIKETLRGIAQFIRCSHPPYYSDLRASTRRRECP